jgi:hypothetical protein
VKKTNCRINRLGADPGHYFFGYYDKCPWDSTHDRLLAHRASFCDRFPSVEDGVQIGYFDLAGSGAFVGLSQTTAWNWQQGAQLQWVQVEGREQILFNKRYDQGIFACLMDVASRKETRLDSSVYTVSRDGSIGLSLNYGRLFNLRQDYGLAGIPDPYAAEDAPVNDGIYRFDFPQGKPELILSIAQIQAFETNPMGEGCMHWINHLMFNPSGGRFCFLHRFMRNDGIVHSRLMSANHDGTGLRLLFEGLVSHYDWLSDDQIFAWAGKRTILAGGSGQKTGLRSAMRKCLKPIYYALGKPRILMQKIVGDSYYLIDDADAQSSVEVAKGILTSDGHCTVSPDRKWILTDGYTDSNNRLPLYLWNLEHERAVELGRYETPKHLDGPLRVDLHPRFSRDGTRVCIDSAMSGRRNMYVLDLKPYLESGA